MSIWKDLGQKLNNVRPRFRPPKVNGKVKQVTSLRTKDKDKVKKPGRSAREKYEYHEPEASVLLNQRAVWDRLKGGEKPEEALGASVSVLKVHHVPTISVIVTTYEPVIRYFEQTLISILSQTYGGFELIIADTSLSSGVKDTLDHYRDERIRYYSVPGNRGEASLINDAAHLAEGNYLCTVDVGDLLTQDALYEVFLCIMRTGAEILYTDEDHCDAAGRKFEQPNRKPDFNKDYLLSNNYMRRLMVIRRELFLALRLRDAFDGALTYDLMLRAPKSEVYHVPLILYHKSSASKDSKMAGREPDADIAAAKAAWDALTDEQKAQVEDPDLLESCNRVAVIDHHRVSASYIHNAALGFIEPYASSACELMTEILQEVTEQTDILRCEAEALLSGIVLDTKSFAIRTGERTFDAAAYLRRSGADTTEVKKLFQTDMEHTVALYKIMQEAEQYRNIAVAAPAVPQNRVVAAKAADELLNISGVDASVVISPDGKGGAFASARSIGEINVQILMEKLGGGGNRSAAAVQMENTSLEDAVRKVHEAIDDYLS